MLALSLIKFPNIPIIIQSYNSLQIKSKLKILQRVIKSDGIPPDTYARGNPTKIRDTNLIDLIVF